MGQSKDHEIPVHRPVILGKSDTLAQAAHAMESNRIGSVLVNGDEGELQGIVTDRDLALAVLLKGALPNNPLKTICSPDHVYSLPETAKIGQVIELMAAHGIRRVPVLRGSKCIGVVSLDDLVQAGLVNTDDQARILRAQLKSDRERVGEAHMKRLFGKQDHQRQKVQEFIRHIMKSTGLSEDEAISLTQQALGVVLRRIPQVGALKFVSQLPKEIQHQVYCEATPGDQEMDREELLKQICSRYELSPSKAEELLHTFWKAISDRVSRGDIEHLAAQLPKELRKDLAFQEAH